MLIKTKEFVKKLNSRLYQYSFNRKMPLSLKGSFHYTHFISDIDFTAYVYFNEKFIEILIHKLERLKDFKVKKVIPRDSYIEIEKILK